MKSTFEVRTKSVRTEEITGGQNPINGVAL